MRLTRYTDYALRTLMFLGFTLSKLPRYGFLSMMHEARTDFALWLGLVFLLIVGAGGWSFDAQRGRSKSGP